MSYRGVKQFRNARQDRLLREQKTANQTFNSENVDLQERVEDLETYPKDRSRYNYNVQQQNQNTTNQNLDDITFEMREPFHTGNR